MNKVVHLFPYRDIMPRKANHNEYSGEISMKTGTFRKIIDDSLKVVGELYSPAASNLLLGTALQESMLDVVEQDHGPALGFMQMEPATYEDLQKYLALRQPKMKVSILAACYTDMFPSAECLTWNIRLSILMARVQYYRVAEKLPAADDSEGMCHYYLKYYNAGGKATFEKSLHCFDWACGKY